MYYPGQLERRYGIDFPLAIAMENAGMPYGLGALWAGSGARYSWKGVCNCPSLIPISTNAPRDLRLGGAGRLAHPDEVELAASARTTRASAGTPRRASVGTALDLVTPNAASNGFAARYPYNTIGVFGQGWDDFSTKNLRSSRPASRHGPEPT